MTALSAFGLYVTFIVSLMSWIIPKKYGSASPSTTIPSHSSLVYTNFLKVTCETSTCSPKIFLLSFWPMFERRKVLNFTTLVVLNVMNVIGYQNWNYKRKYFNHFHCFNQMEGILLCFWTRFERRIVLNFITQVLWNVMNVTWNVIATYWGSDLRLRGKTHDAPRDWTEDLPLTRRTLYYWTNTSIYHSSLIMITSIITPPLILLF